MLREWTEGDRIRQRVKCEEVCMGAMWYQICGEVVMWVIFSTSFSRFPGLARGIGALRGPRVRGCCCSTREQYSRQ
ncbi:hypothetical protein BJX96DRAFT_93211 [Aspergillus floccosus]